MRYLTGFMIDILIIAGLCYIIRAPWWATVIMLMIIWAIVVPPLARREQMLDRML